MNLIGARRLKGLPLGSFVLPIPRRADLADIAESAFGPKPAPWGDRAPIRDVLFSIQRLEEHARSLARTQAVTDEPARRYALTRRVADNAKSLQGAYRRLSMAAGAREAISPAAEWIIDNYHIIERQIREIRRDLPPGYYRRLPKLASGPLRGYPRILGAAWAYVAHTDSHFSPDSLCRFLHAYQEVQPLMIGELWAIPITLRILLVENLRRFAELSLLARDARASADEIGERILHAAALGAAPLASVLSEMNLIPLTGPFVVHLAQRLRDQDPSVTPAMAWLDQRLAFEGTTVDETVQAEQQREINATVTVRNIITSMRLANDVDWRELFERMSLVDDLLNRSTSYSSMDFPTRDLYRAAIEEIARGAKHSELEVARSVVATAAHAPPPLTRADVRPADPGYYLIAEGRRPFERALGYRPPLDTWLSRFIKQLGIAGYIGATGLAATLLLLLPLNLLAGQGVDWPLLLGFAILGALPAIDAGVSLVNYLFTRGLRATLLPGIELPDGVPENLRTIVVVPTLLTSPEAIEELIERLEVHYLASPKGEVYFALLSDWTDADSEHVEGDEDLLDIAQRGISRLNRKYEPGGAGDRFLLLHRRRVWTPSERKWIGWERKRGKLSELNELLTGGGETTFFGVDSGPPRVPVGVRYVVTLDSDTRLTPDAIRRLIGKMAHPLNTPRFDSGKQRVVEGYAILQPRVTPSMPVGYDATPFLRIFSSMTGIDPYSAAASDVYQDLLGEGSYTGKGIYDVEAFRAALAGRVPPSSLLSHDLFEGAFARSGLVSDIEFVEAFPTRYDSAAMRHHRWARGDWQLLPWILGVRRAASPLGARAGVPVIGRWKMIDNLRRTMLAPSTAIALLAGFTLPFNAALAWTAFVLATIALPAFIPVAASLAQRARSNLLRHRLGSLGSDFRLALTQWLLATTFLAHQAWLMADAAIRTLYRLVVGKRLLEWTPAAQAALEARRRLPSYYRYMAGAVILGVAGAAAGWLARGHLEPLSAAFALLWIASPGVALWVSQPPRPPANSLLSSADVAALRLIARRTWRYFETFVTAAHNMLPPDNFQEIPDPVVAHRTSPTNIGLYLLAVVSARELGWINTPDAVERLEATYATLMKLERFRGHYYNWYDTQDLRALEPRYVSSVDSGNLAGHLITLAATCMEWSVRPQSEDFCLDAEAFAIAREEARELRGKRRLPALPWPQIELEIELLEKTLRGLPCSEGDLGTRVTELGAATDAIIDTLEAHALSESDNASADLLYWLRAASRSLKGHARELAATDSDDLDMRLDALARAFRNLALSMDFSFLLDRDRLLLSIGYRGSDGVLDPSCYDLLASEARLASLFAIAKGDAPNNHWFRLSHTVVPLPQGAALISWSGSMFEYLMPSLVMQEPVHSVLERTNRLIVNRQIEYGRGLRVPWGVSESAYNARDLDFTYQYSNFGVPGLGLKRGLADNLVISPYATALAAMVSPVAAVRNFEHLAEMGARGRYGFYEAIDFTPERLQSGQQAEVVRCFMAHHQGMTITALANVLCNGVLRRRFHADPMIQASELLLQERMPRDIQAPPPLATVHHPAVGRVAQIEPTPHRRHANPWSASPATHLLSNGRYTVMLTAAGSGYSMWRGLAITRWREDATRDDWGSYFYVRDAEGGECLSPTLQPVCHRGHGHRAIFDEEKAEFTSQTKGLTTTLEVIVSEEDDAEVRRISIKNLGTEPRDLEITSYTELALAAPAADLAHPAFSKLFVEVEHLPRSGALLARRRKRSPDEPEVWAAHLAVVQGAVIGQREFETDRAKFLGRCRDVHEPIVALSGSPLSGSVGATLDPIFALRRRVRAEPGETARIHFWTMAAGSRQEALELIDKHNDVAAYERAAALSWTQSQVELHHIGIDRNTAALFQRLAGHLIYATPAMRPSSDFIGKWRGEQPLLWSLGVSGDLPILLVRVSEMQEIHIVEEALQAFEYFRTKWLPVDLVILNERSASYQQDLQVALENVVRASQSRPHIGAEQSSGHIYVLRADLIPAEARELLSAVARVVLRGDRGRLGDQLRRRPETEHFGLRTRRNASVSALQPPSLSPGLDYFNGLGGFATDANEYVIKLAPGQSTPAPWINVVANPSFGFQTSESGAGFVWSESSREHQITPWSNDPVADAPGQAFFIRDRDTGEVWSPTAAPIRNAAATYVARHGRGYSKFECEAPGLTFSLREYVPMADPIKISRLAITNTAGIRRRLSVTAYVEWALGSSRMAAPFVATERDAATGAIFASNRWNAAYRNRVAFADFRGRQESWSGDRREFIGRNGSLSNPAALSHDAPLSGRLGAGFDPCAALQTTLELDPGQTAELDFLLGDAASADDASALVTQYRSSDLDAVLDEVRAFWEELLGAIQVKTPDRSFDLMVNGWLLYQTLACRIWARSGFYQASGAYGFRDQLQDVMTLAAHAPQLVRAHLLRAAARQFPEGDVQHWWLPDTGQGVRTRISDDRIWLAVAVSHYVRVTGDSAVLDEQIPFLAGQRLEEEEAEAFFRAAPSEQIASLYEHCARALDASLDVGPHGAPLIGGGDWNDGMNRVGLGGQGESVWLGWFLHTALSAFAPIAESRNDVQRARTWSMRAGAIGVALEGEAWDGDWYRRGWYDDGAPLGSAANEECRLDSIAQSWAVLSGAGEPQRARRAMAAVERDLIRPQDGVALLFAPPFDRTTRDPGYIKGYPPGVRENGGQYTHGAVWSVMAFAELHEGDKAAALFWMLNPINHARTRADVHRYKVEPYVMAADVYSAPTLIGRGGWTWYTGSAGLMYRAGVENILGLRFEGDYLLIDPCIPRSWPEFQMTLRLGGDIYNVSVANPNGVSHGVASITLDGTLIAERPARAPIKKSGTIHRLDIVLG